MSLVIENVNKIKNYFGFVFDCKDTKKCLMKQCENTQVINIFDFFQAFGYGNDKVLYFCNVKKVQQIK